ncbi:MAG: ABC transporter ATP-binding protein/permease [Oscillospiraceae bacterium]|jgi:ATP-binding cassette subfamily B protein|nr:ABC transporter ATP-binding protein/permease [Oscillospiraceae bacterium]
MKRFQKLRYITFLLKPYWKHGKMYPLMTLIMQAVLQPLSSTVSVLLPKAAIDSVTNGSSTARTLATVGAYTAVIIVIAILTRIISNTSQAVMQIEIQYAIQLEVNEKAIGTDFKYYDNPEFFSQFTYAQQYFAMYSNNAVMQVTQMVGAVSSIIAMGAIIASAELSLILVSVIFVILSMILRLPQTKGSVELSAKLTDQSRFAGYVGRSLQQKENAAELRSSGAGAKMLRAYKNSLRKYVDIIRDYYKTTSKFYLPQAILTPLQSSIILVYIVLFIIAGDTSKIGLYASLTAATSTLTANFSMLFSFVNDILEIALQGEKIARFFEAESTIEPPNPNAVPAPDGVYSVELRDIAFGYENSAFGIKGFNLNVKPGQRVAIVGENGAGKSTLTKLLLRLYDVDGGTVLINGRDIRDYDVHALRRHIGIAYQDVRILAMSLRDNLTVYNDATDEELLRVIDRLGLQSVLEKASGNLDVQISREFTEDGVVLSGGEAQRVALARLFTGSFGLLLLDEPSSALDPLAEYNLMQVILDKSNTATTIMIAHRLSTVRNFDIIYHVENGEIIESGTHDELIAAQGKYYEMFTRQGENYNN